MRKKLCYGKVLTIEKDENQLVAEIRDQFQIYGNIEDINLSPQSIPFQFKASVIIIVEQNFGEFEQWAYLNGWEKEKEFMNPK